MDRLENGDALPEIRAATLDGDGVLTLPDDLRGSPTLLLFYRGHW
jgi:peroxiredoxin